MDDKVVTEKMGEALVLTGTRAQIDWMRSVINEISGAGQYGVAEYAVRRLDFRLALTERTMVADLDGRVLRVSPSARHCSPDGGKRDHNTVAYLRATALRATSLNLSAAYAWQFAAQTRASGLGAEEVAAATQQASEANDLAEEASSHLNPDALLDAENVWLAATYERILASSGESIAREWRRAERDACHRQRVISDSAKTWRADAKQAYDACMRTR